MGRRHLGWLIAGLVACGGTSGTVGGASADSGAAADEADAGGAVPTEEPDRTATTDGTCNALGQRGERVGVYLTQEPAPEPAGGVVEDGVYVLTAVKVWGSSGSEGRRIGSARATTQELRRGAIHVVSAGTLAGEDDRWSGTFSATGTDFTMNATCMFPDGKVPDTPGKAEFTAGPSALHLFGKSPDGTHEWVYTRRE